MKIKKIEQVNEDNKKADKKESAGLKLKTRIKAGGDIATCG